MTAPLRLVADNKPDLFEQLQNSLPRDNGTANLPRVALDSAGRCGGEKTGHLQPMWIGVRPVHEKPVSLIRRLLAMFRSGAQHD